MFACGSFDGHSWPWPPIKMPPPCQMANLHSFAALGHVSSLRILPTWTLSLPSTMPILALKTNTLFLIKLMPKRRFSEFPSEPWCNQEYACSLEQVFDDEAEPVGA